MEPDLAAGTQYLILLGARTGAGPTFSPNGRADAFDVTDRLVKPVGRTVVAKAQSGRTTVDFLAEGDGWRWHKNDKCDGNHIPPIRIRGSV